MIIASSLNFFSRFFGGEETTSFATILFSTADSLELSSLRSSFVPKKVFTGRDTVGTQIHCDQASK